MTTKFYDALQLDPSILKRRIAACETKKEKNFYRAAMAVRSALIVAFAILFISLLSGLFGADNTPMAVALFCMLLGIRFVNFEYCAGDSLAGLALVAPLHFAAFFALLFLTSQRPEMGNGGIYSFAYIYLTGNPVAGEALARRGLMALAGWLLCGAILLAKHRGRHADTRFHHLVRRFRLSRPECLWRLRMALGVSLVLAAGQVFGVERFMWMGFACGSLQSEYPLPGSAAVRFWQRIAGGGGGLRRLCPALSGAAGRPAPAAGAPGRVLHGLLHRLPLQDGDELLRRADDRRGALRPFGGGGAASGGHGAGRGLRPLFRRAVPPAVAPPSARGGPGALNRNTKGKPAHRFWRCAGFWLIQ